MDCSDSMCTRRGVIILMRWRHLASSAWTAAAVAVPSSRSLMRVTPSDWWSLRRAVIRLSAHRGNADVLCVSCDVNVSLRVCCTVLRVCPADSLPSN